MRFNFEAYEKVFPVEEPKAVIESAVHTFKPTESEKPTEQAGEDVMSATPAEEVPPNDDSGSESIPEGGTNE